MSSTTSLVVMIPRSPWLTSPGWTKKAGVPVLAQVGGGLGGGRLLGDVLDGGALGRRGVEDFVRVLVRCGAVLDTDVFENDTELFREILDLCVDLRAALGLQGFFDDRDAAFDAGMPFSSSSKPGLFLMLTAFFRFLTWFRKDNPFDASVFSFGFIIG